MNNTKGKYTMRHHVRHALCALTALLLLLGGMAGARAQTWTDVDIGSPTAPGSSTYNGGVLTVTGAGTGDTTSYSNSDQLHYTYLTNAGGDLDIIARVASFSGNPHARAGIMLRTTNDPSATTTANGVFAYQDAGGGQHNIFYTGRDQASATASGGGATTNMVLPLWLRLVRKGNYFAVYKSQDGVIWSDPSAGCGWQFIPSGAIEVGFFAAGGAAGTTCTASFDNIDIAPRTSAMPPVGSATRSAAGRSMAMFPIGSAPYGRPRTAPATPTAPTTRAGNPRKSTRMAPSSMPSIMGVI